MAQFQDIIHYGIHQTFIGPVVLAKTAEGVCWFGFMVEGYKGNGLDRLKRFYPDALIVHDDEGTTELMHMILDAWELDRLDTIAIDLRGTDFQKAVWRALLDIPKGEVVTYSDIARSIGRPMAARAVGSAVGENPVSLVVPCHRVVQASGGIGNYGWGVDIKRNLLLEEDVVLAA